MSPRAAVQYQIGERVVVRLPGEPEEIGRITQERLGVYAVHLESGPLVWIVPASLRRLTGDRRWRA